jgi:hypothetical protein
MPPLGGVHCFAAVSLEDETKLPHRQLPSVSLAQPPAGLLQSHDPLLGQPSSAQQIVPG